MKNPSEEELEQWHNDPKNWKLGLFYYNPDDERLFPPKRMKWAGWTVNFANPKSIASFVVLVLVLLLFVYRKQLF